MPCDYKKYPPEWKERRARILERSGNRCEWDDDGKRCGAINYEPHPLTGSRVVLTIAHMDHDPENWDVKDERLRAWCQLHHNRYDRKHRNETRRAINVSNPDND